METLLTFFLLDALIGCVLWKHVRNKFCVLPALIAGGTALWQILQARKQGQLANSLKPVDGVPPAVKEAESTARRGANATASPGYVRGLEKIRQSTSNTIDNARRLGNPNAIRGAVADADAREKMLIKDLEVSNEAYRASQSDRLTNILMQKGLYQKQAQDQYNATISALRGAASRNTYNALTTLGEGVVTSLPDSAFDSTGRASRLQNKVNTGGTLKRGQQKYLDEFKIRQGWAGGASGEARGLNRLRRGIAYNPNEFLTEDSLTSSPF